MRRSHKSRVGHGRNGIVRVASEREVGLYKVGSILYIGYLEGGNRGGSRGVHKVVIPYHITY